MKKIFATLLVTTLFSLAHSDVQYEELLFIPWGSDPGQAGIRLAPGGQFGPGSFVIQNDSIILLDSENQRLSIFKDKKLIDTIPISLPFSDDFAWHSADHFYLLNENRIFEFRNNMVQNKYVTDSPRQIFTGFKHTDSHISFILNDQTVEYPAGGSLHKRSAVAGIENADGNIIRVEKSSFTEASIFRNQQQFISVRTNSNNLGVVRFVGGNIYGDIYLYVEHITAHSPLKVNRYIHIYSSDGDLVAEIALPVQMYTYIFREFYVDNKGDLYHMLSTTEGIYIIRWKINRDNQVIQGKYIYPEKFSTMHHYNYLEEAFRSDLLLNKPVSVDAINETVNRAEALAIGDTYVQHQWTAGSENLTSGRIKDPNNVDIETPPWVVIGQNTKIPYQWGGDWTIPQFDQGLLDNKYAGDIATTGVSAYSVGVDCSGYVSRCWKLHTHYSTSMMDDNITIAYDSWDELLPADAIHKVGHVRMFVKFNTDGSLLVVESSGRDWRVSYRSYTYGELTSYTPRYYINMQGTPNTIPRPVLSSVLTTDSLKIRWQVSDPNAISGFNIYHTYDGNLWEVLNGDNIIQSTSDHLNIIRETGLAGYIKMTATDIENPESESYSSDIYGYKYIPGTAKILIVDGFDRTDGSFSAPFHAFAMYAGQALNTYNVSFETADNDAVAAQEVALSDYTAVFWLLGDESVNAETFTNAEQEIVKVYLRQGGKLFVSGSEVAWDLDSKGSETDKAFFHDYLCAEFYRDDANSYTVNGADGTVFEDLHVHYDDGTHGIYEENYPDAYSTINGSQAVLFYENGYIAATAMTGVLPQGTESAQVILLGFSLETIYDPDERVELAGRILQYFGLIETALPDKNLRVPLQFSLLGNYPNPFNPTTNFRFTIPERGHVQLRIYDLLGRRVTTVIDKIMDAGEHSYTYNAAQLASGTYIYIIGWNGLTLKGRMQLIK